MKARKFILITISVLVLAIGGLLTYHFLTQNSATKMDAMDIENMKSAEDAADELFGQFDE